MGDNTREVIRNEETVVSGEPEQTTVSQTTSSAGTTAGAPVMPAASQTTVQSSSSSTAPSDRVVSHNVSERVVDPAADKAAAVGWVNKLIWTIVGIMAALLLIRFVLLLAGADPGAGFAQLIGSLTDWMVAPFAGLFGAPIALGEGGATTSRFAPEVLVAIIVYLLLGFLVTKLAELMLGTNRTTGTIVSDNERNTRL